MSPDSSRTSQSCTKGKPEEDGALPEGLPDLQHRPEERTGHQDRLHPRPHPPRILSCQWLSSVFCQDMLSRLEEVKAAITSVYGRILKVDSTKKVAKKLQGSAVETAAWATNVGNEHGQVLLSILTTGEGAGLDSMSNAVLPGLRPVPLGLPGRQHQLSPRSRGPPPRTRRPSAQKEEFLSLRKRRM